MNRPQALALEFSRRLQELLGDKIHEVNDLNRAEINPGICHTHDFCDPNQVMLDAMAALGYENEDRLWNRAWYIAKSYCFNPDQLEKRIDNLYHERVFVLSYSTKGLPKFETNQETDAFHQALGRMVAYGLYGDKDEEEVSLVQASLLDGVEICGAYQKHLPRYIMNLDGDYRYCGSNAERVSEFIGGLRTQNGDARPFIMAAVKHDDHWGFHS